jgi:hypothetical protein
MKFAVGFGIDQSPGGGTKHWLGPSAGRLTVATEMCLISRRYRRDDPSDNLQQMVWHRCRHERQNFGNKYGWRPSFRECQWEIRNICDMASFNIKLKQNTASTTPILSFSEIQVTGRIGIMFAIGKIIVRLFLQIVRWWSMIPYPSFLQQIKPETDNTNTLLRDIQRNRSPLPFFSTPYNFLTASVAFAQHLDLIGWL